MNITSERNKNNILTMALSIICGVNITVSSRSISETKTLERCLLQIRKVYHCEDAVVMWVPFLSGLCSVAQV